VFYKIYTHTHTHIYIYIYIYIYVMTRYNNMIKQWHDNKQKISIAFMKCKAITTKYLFILFFFEEKG